VEEKKKEDVVWTSSGDLKGKRKVDKRTGVEKKVNAKDERSKLVERRVKTRKKVENQSLLPTRISKEEGVKRLSDRPSSMAGLGKKRTTPPSSRRGARRKKRKKKKNLQGEGDM